MEEKHVTSERGKSRPYKDFSYYNAAEERKDILDVEDIKYVVLVGQSAGGFVAQSFYKNYPDMVEGILTGSCEILWRRCAAARSMQEKIC